MSVAARAGATLTIDLAAIAANHRLLCDRLGYGATCAAVVKADAYGLGIAHVAPALANAGCRDFFVASVDEGVALRGLLRSRAAEAAIYVFLGPESDDSTGDLIANNVTPVLNDPRQIEVWSRAARAAGRALDAIVHIDTGMSRLGLQASDVIRLAAAGGALDGVMVRAVMSHLACADDPSNPMNEEQLARFEEVRRLLPAAPASLANSAGILLGPRYHFDMVRPGIALYGGNPLMHKDNVLSQVINITSFITQVREIDRGHSVGYGATHRAAGPTRIATVPVGYADGYLRSLSNNAAASVGGVRVPVVGRVSMDLITLDVTAVPPERCQPGCPVELIGDAVTLDEVAAAAGTISYEILTRLGPRLRREYVGGPEA